MPSCCAYDVPDFMAENGVDSGKKDSQGHLGGGRWKTPKQHLHWNSECVYCFLTGHVSTLSPGRIFVYGSPCMATPSSVSYSPATSTSLSAPAQTYLTPARMMSAQTSNSALSLGA